MEEIRLSPKGKLWSYTINYYPLPPPYKPPEVFEPFGIGEVEFPEGVRVIGMITGCDAEKDLEIGIDMDLVFETLFVDDDGSRS